jgi:predicted ATPase
MLTTLHIKNFRSLVDVTINIDGITVLFGPNGAGKSTFLEALWFARDCAIRGVDQAASERGHGIGLRWEGAERNEPLVISIETPAVRYKMLFGYYSAGRIDKFVGEELYSKLRDLVLIDRPIGSDKATFHGFQALLPFNPGELSEPEKPSFARYLEFLRNIGQPEEISELTELDSLLRGIRFYHARSANFYGLRTFGSESGYETRLSGRGDNLWSVLRNLHDKQILDPRYNTIMSFMKESFPSFTEIVLEQTGTNSVYAMWIDKLRRKPIQASGVSDGHLQMLMQLTALFSEDGYGLVLLDEPDLSLHPWALSVLAKAIQTANQSFQKQVVIATHSPVLISQFAPEQILAVELSKDTGQTMMTKVSELEEIRDLLEEYATGSLYMAEMIAAQSERLENPAI